MNAIWHRIRPTAAQFSGVKVFEQHLNVPAAAAEALIVKEPSVQLTCEHHCSVSVPSGASRWAHTQLSWSRRITSRVRINWTPQNPAQNRTAPQRPAEFRTEFWPVSLRRVCSELMRCCWYRQLTVFCKVLLVSDWSSLRCSGFILDSSNRTWSPVQTETVRRPSLFEFTVFGPAHEGRTCL